MVCIRLRREPRCQTNKVGISLQRGTDLIGIDLQRGTDLIGIDLQRGADLIGIKLRRGTDSIRLPVTFRSIDLRHATEVSRIHRLNKASWLHSRRLPAPCYLVLRA